MQPNNVPALEYILKHCDKIKVYCSQTNEQGIVLKNSIKIYVEIKGQLDATDWYFIAKLTVCSTYFGHHYTHHQELYSYTGGCCLWYLTLWFTGRWSGVEIWVMCPV
jgi:hypothetical protein